MIAIPASGDRHFLGYFGLTHHPFPVAPDDENFFISEHIELITAELVHGILSRKGFLVLTGEVGLGKTTISRRIMSILGENDVETALVFHTSLQDAELLRQINRDFGITGGQGDGHRADLGDQMSRLNEFLLARNKEGKNCAIIIDDAQNLSAESLEMVRMISNLEAGCQKLVQILLVGQPELIHLLSDPALRQLRSRIVIKAIAKPLAREELRQYVQFKLNVAGSGGQINFTPPALRKIYGCTRGNFRQVNVLMDRILYAACLYDARYIGTGIVKYAFNDLHSDTRKLKKPLAWAAAVIPAILLVFLLLSVDHARQDPIPEQPVVSVHTIGDVPDAVHTSGSGSKDEVIPHPGNKIAMAMVQIDQMDQMGQTADPNSDADPLVQFLRSHKLSDFAGEFKQSIASGDFKHLNQNIRNKTGYQLIRLNRLPENIKGKYGVYAHMPDENGRPEFFLFWRPDFEVAKFYYYYQGREIKDLQQLLANIDLYQKKTDEIVGSKLMKAIVAFQKMAGIEVTGYPDTTTLFLLSHARENMNNG
ncbi:MAG: AAA family ATPase [Desulfobacteraceae bacterium]|nr:AAA family ATPase [Desulfobacteraceae bacterium]